MQLEHRCSPCHGTGSTVTNDPYEPPSTIPCPFCGAKGYNVEEILFPEYGELTDKLDTLQKAIKKLQDDVDYIKKKVG